MLDRQHGARREINLGDQDIDGVDPGLFSGGVGARFFLRVLDVPKHKVERTAGKCGGDGEDDD